MSDLDNLEELDLTIEKHQLSSGADNCQRQTIMRQLLNELLITNDWLEKERTHPFSSLEVIIEEVTPCSSSQQLENNLSTIKAGLQTHTEDLDQESAIDSDEEDTRRKFSHNENSLKREKNMYSFKRYEKSDNSDDSSISVRTGRTFNSNISMDGNKCKRNVESIKENVEHQTTIEDAEILFSKFEKYINDDERYVQRDKIKRRNKFLTLNHNYDRNRIEKIKRKVCSTSNLSQSDEPMSFWTKKPEKTKRPLTDDPTYKRKYCSTSNLSESDEPASFWGKNPVKTKEPVVEDTKCTRKCSTSNLSDSDESFRFWRKKTSKPEKYTGNVSFSCSNSYSVKNKPSAPTNTKRYCGKVDFACKKKYALKKSTDDNISVEELEARLQYFENQYLNLQKELNNARDAQLTLMKGNEASSSEDEVHCPPNRTFNLDRGDGKSMNDFNNAIDKTDKIGHSDSSPNESIPSLKDNKSSEINTDTDRTERKDTENKPSYSGNIFIAKKPSKDSGLQTYSTTNSRDIDEVSTHEEFPKVMYATVNKNVATQVTDDDWVRICTAKKEMAMRGCLKLSLPNSSDDEMLDDVKSSERKVEFKPKTTVIYDSSDYSDLSSSKKPTLIADTTGADLVDKDCSCFPCFIRCFRSRR